MNWYAALAVIIVLGVLSVVYAGYEYRNPSSAATATTPPTTKTTWYAGITFDVCGTVQPSLASNAATSGKSKSFYTTGDGVITISPQSTSDAGKNAVLGKLISGYSGLTLTSTQLGLPASTSSTSHSKDAHTTVYKNGDTCPSGTPDHGKVSEVQVTYWPSAFSSSAKATTVPGDPATLRFTDHQLISVGFVPSGTKLAKPSGTIVEALLKKTPSSSSSSATTVPSGATTTPTTAAPSTATTPTTAAPSAATTTTAAPTTTTAAPTTTTTKK